MTGGGLEGGAAST